MKISKSIWPKILKDYTTARIPVREIAETYGVSQSLVRYIARTSGVEKRPKGLAYKPPQKTIEKVKTLYQKGYSALEVGQQTNLSSERVREILKEEGVEIKPRGFYSRILSDAEEKELAELYMN